MLVILLTVQVFSSGAFADDTGQPQLTEQDYLGELPVVLSTSRLAQRLDTSPLPITVIDRQIIDASGAQTIEDVLRLVPGMLVGHDNGNQAFVTYDGFAERFARRMQVLIDGRSVYSPTFGGVDWSALPVALEDVERIEVIRGPDAAAYGANAFLGVINIITRHPKAEQGGYAKLLLGTDNTNRAMARYGEVLNNLSYRVTAVTGGDHGFNIADGVVDSVPTNGSVNDKQTSLVNGRFDYDTDSGSRWGFQFGDSYGWRAQGAPLNVLYPPHRYDTGWNFQQLSWQRNISDANDLSFNIYHQFDQTSERFLTLPVFIPPAGLITAALNYDNMSNRYDAELQQTLTLSPTFRAVWGAGMRLDQVTSYSYLGTASPIDDRDYRLFGHAEWRITSDLYGNLGAMLEKADIGGTALSPTAALNYTFAPGRTLRVSASSATRYPVVIEEDANQHFSAGPIFDQVLASSGDLGPERIRSYDLGYVGELHGPQLWVDARLFYSDVKDLIAYYNIPFPSDNFDGKAQDFANRDSAILSGAETQFNYNPTPDTRVIVNYAYLDITGASVSGSAPHHNFSILAMHTLSNGIDVSMGFYFLSSMSGLDTGTPIASQRRLDLRLAAPLPQLTPGARLSIILQSVLGSYQDFKYVNIFEPRILVQLSTPF
ncbi:MAG: TonB-dependent receptor plug domain-containing protein [Gammaproteobacteria bacterium]|nr:TonB-dependent receptor plug domain-containing protein [Gammaproteobacteria bacterium]